MNFFEVAKVLIYDKPESTFLLTYRNPLIAGMFLIT
jgi:hypothetical protein